jgi:TPP-dependent pyruvate/acetoin dehydrogenase alpha subunit
MSNSLPITVLYKKMLLIRYFEEGVLKLFEQGKLFGTTHAYIGQEANAVGVITNLKESDTVVSNHRCHGHYITHKQKPYALLCEMMGKADGLCSGRGGSQHICDDGFFSNGVQGGILPLAAGLAFSEKFKKSKNIVAVFIGDGTLGEGVLYETLNIVSKWELPLLIVVENNRYAQSTKIELTLAGKIKDRFTAFNIETEELDTFNVSKIHHVSSKMIIKIRKTVKPACLILNTYRFVSHSKSDDGRSKSEVEKWKKKDPLKIAEKELNERAVKNIQLEISDLISHEITRAIEAPMAE